MNERDIFIEAVRKKDAPDRRAYLDQACVDDRNLRHRVDILLQVHERAGNFLEPVVPVLANTLEMPQFTEHLGTVIGPYKLVEQIGEGGFGVVYLAEQQKPVRRRVALKIIKPGMDTRQVIARFEAERQALALMNHPNIAHVLDAGTTDSGRPYFVMELVRGIPITGYCDQCNLTTRDRLELFVLVCQAIQHAHQKGVIHRDIKPSNVLVTLNDGRPTPKVIDFGVAKAINQRLTDATAYTQFAQMVGTPLYMSPEQAGMSSLDVDTRSDIYSLGVLLYELLTGTTPFEKERLKEASYDELRRILREEEPPKPSQRLSTVGPLVTTVAEQRRTDPRRLSQLVRGDLDWIVMKALEKDPTRRYQTASAFAADVQRYLENEPIEARPPSALYKFRKFARRNRAALSTVALVLVAVVASLAIHSILIAQERDTARQAAQREGQAADQARLERQQALRQQNLALENLYFAHMQLAHHDWQSGAVGRMRSMLDAHIPSAAEPDLRGWEWYYLLSLCHRDQLTLRGHTAGVNSVSCSPDGQKIASGSSDHTVRIWDTQSGRAISILYGHENAVRSVSWCPDGKRLAGDSGGKVLIWDVDTGAKLRVLNWDEPVYVTEVAWSPDGQRIAASGHATKRPYGTNGVITIWDANSGKKLHTVIGDIDIVWSLSWGPDGRYLVSGGGSSDNALRIWDTSTGQLAKTATIGGAHGHRVGTVAWSPDGRRFASASLDQTIKFWERDTWKNRLVISEAHRGEPYSVSWSVDGKQLASGGEDGLVKIWDVSTGQEVAVLRGHTGSVRSVYWRRTDRLLVSGSADATIKLWNLSIEPAFRTIAGRQRAAWSPDGRLLATGTTDPNAKSDSIDIFEVATARRLFGLPNKGVIGTGAIAWSPDSQRIAAGLGGNRGAVVVWDVSTRKEVLNVAAHGLEARSVAWSPDSRLVVSGGSDGLVHVWAIDSGKIIQTLKGHQGTVGSVRFSPDGNLIASSSWDREVKIWEWKTGRPVHEFKRPGSWMADGQYSITWSPAGDRLASGCSNGDIIVWDAATGREIRSLRGHTSQLRAVDWSPDGKRLASVGYDRYLKIWDAESGRELLSLPGHKESIHSVAWSPNGQQLVTAVGTEVKIWDASIGYRLARESEEQ